MPSLAPSLAHASDIAELAILDPAFAAAALDGAASALILLDPMGEVLRVNGAARDLMQAHATALSQAFPGLDSSAPEGGRMGLAGVNFSPEIGRAHV